MEVPIQLNFHLPSDAFQDWQLLEGQNAEVVWVGNSRTAFHFDTPQIEKKTGKRNYTVGQDGHNVRMLYHKLDVYLNGNPAPQYLFFQADPIILSEGRFWWYGRSLFLKYLWLDRFEIQSKNAHLLGHKKLDEFIPTLRYVGEPVRYIRDALGIPDKRNCSQGFLKQAKEWENPVPFVYNGEVWEVDTILAHWVIQKLSNDPRLIETEVYMSIPPIAAPIHPYLDPDRVVRQLSSANGLKYIDWNLVHDMGTERYNDSTLFYNFSHLNHRGTAVLTEDVVNFLRIK